MAQCKVYGVYNAQQLVSQGNVPFNNLFNFIYIGNIARYRNQKTMEEIMLQIPVNEVIKDALINHEGKCGMLCDLVLSYERAEWDKINKYAEELQIPTNSIAQVYFDSVESVNEIWNEMTTLPEKSAVFLSQAASHIFLLKLGKCVFRLSFFL